MIVLHEDDGRSAFYFFENGLGKLPVYRTILRPVVGIKSRSRIRDVAERPERLVREAVVVALFFLLGQPHVPQGVRRLVRRNRHASELVAHDAVRVMSDELGRSEEHTSEL